MYILGISALYHDSAAALIKDGEIISAVQEERFTRKKHDMRIPKDAIKYCLESEGISAGELDYVVYYDNPLLTLDRFLNNCLALGDMAEPLLESSYQTIFSQKIWVHEEIRKTLGGILGKRNKLIVAEHHISHAASAFYPSPFESAVVITIDGVGEWATTTIGIGKSNQIELKEEIRYPHSLGLLYSAFTYFCGFKVNSGDYKFMGLAPYGKPIYYDVLKEKIITVRKDGSYKLNLDYFDYYKGGTMINEEKFAKLFNGPRRMPESEITKREMDIAASVQKLVEEIILLLVCHAKVTYGKDIDYLVLAGGVALNCVANGKILREQVFKNIWIQPAAGDAGGALGSALYAYYHYLGNARKIDHFDSQKGSYLGPQYNNAVIKDFLESNVYPCHFFENEKLYKKVALELKDEKVIGLFHGRMEFGPRALGNRSIIADPRSSQMQSKLNLKIKYRESFRPFAPSVLEECYQNYFELKAPSPYMLLVDEVRKEHQMPFQLDDFLNEKNSNLLPIVNMPRSDIPAITHVDYSARVQTVSKQKNEHYYNIIKAFQEETGCGIIVNTSFNVRGEPIVCTPQQAYECFMRTEMDVLVLENYILYKEEQPEFVEKEDWRLKYELD